MVEMDRPSVPWPDDNFDDVLGWRDLAPNRDSTDRNVRIARLNGQVAPYDMSAERYAQLRREKPEAENHPSAR